MKTQAVFQILNSNAPRLPYAAYVDAKIFSELAGLAYDAGFCRKPPAKTGYLIPIKASFPSDALDEIMRILSEKGWRPI
jgi:hypothetical protein